MLDLICILRIKTYILTFKLNFLLFLFCYRTSIEYQQGALNFVHAAKRKIRNIEKKLCPCTDCQNLSRHDDHIIVEHLIMKGMDPRYKSSIWYNHGEEINEEKKAKSFDVYDIFLEYFFFT